MSYTPDQKWRKSVILYRKNCQKILGVSKSIRYAGAINEYGRTLAGVIRPGIKPFLKHENAKNEFFILSNLMTLHGSQSKALGEFNHATLKHQKVTIICIPANKIIYYVSVDSTAKSIDEIIKKIKSVL